MLVKKISSIIINLLTLCFIATAITPLDSYAKNKSNKKSKIVYSPIEASIVVDGRSGKVLHAKNARQKIYPASLTKVMTLYLLFESLESGKFSLNHKLYVSHYATKAKPSKLYLKPGDKITVRDSILAMSVKSANDVAKVIAENISGSEAKFAKLMTIRARQLGMNNTIFRNASGWHDPKHISTAVDLAKLSIAIKRDFPQYYHFFGKQSFAYNGKTIKGHNKITAMYPGAEGLKTGFHVPSGHNLITSATRNNKSLVGIVTGEKNSSMRDQKMIKLLDKHFDVVKKTNQKPSKKTRKKSKKLA